MLCAKCENNPWIEDKIKYCSCCGKVISHVNWEKSKNNIRKFTCPDNTTGGCPVHGIKYHNK